MADRTLQTLQTPFRRPSDGGSDGLQTPLRRPSYGVQTPFTHSPHTPLCAPRPLEGGRGRIREGFSLVPMPGNPPRGGTVAPPFLFHILRAGNV